MIDKLNILMVDDHPMIIEGYIRVLTSNKKYELNIKVAINCDEAIDAICKSKQTQPFDMVFIDIQLPASKNKLITSGEDIAVIVKRELPKAKIVILTMVNNPIRINNILKTTPHNGVLIKSDITSKILLSAFDKIQKNNTFYSDEVKKLTSKSVTSEDVLDEHNKKIIYYLSKGVKTKKLTEYIPLSLSAIEKRKNFIKQKFSVTGEDEELLLEAKKRGFI